MTNNHYLVRLDWPEKSFRSSSADIEYLRSLLPEGASVEHVRSERAFLRALPKATHAIVWNFKKEWFVKAPRLKLLATPAAGRELIPEVGPEGVKIHFGGFHGGIIAESVVGFMLAFARGFFLKSEKVWPRVDFSDKCYSLSGTKAVVLGYGKIGAAIGAKLKGLGVGVEGFSRKNIEDLPRALKTADWLILALPGTTGTDNIVNAALLKKLPRRAVLVNIGRGNAIDEKALFEALKSKRIAGAYLDVRKVEPALEAPKLENLVLMPHSSAFYPSYVKDCFKELKDEGLL
ncbi:MAG: hypothetical protein MJ109_05000 [Kiritimatiellae bacterium]|nr:hypothetical protein [Kiritimatiellia bacterium]